MSSRILPALVLLACRGVEDPVGAPPPNVLLIVLDDVGQDKVSAYDVHPDPPPTPHLDALADEGLRFTDAWAYPMCSPSRAALLTGQHPRRFGIGQRLTPNVSPWELPADLTATIPQALALAPDAWDTAFLGKWHLSAGTLGEDPLSHPQRHGFGWGEGSIGNLAVALSNDYPQEERTYTRWEEIRDGEIAWKERYATSEVVDDAVERIPQLREPWFAWVALHSIHTPLHTPPAELYDGPEPVTTIEQVDAMVQAMDAEVGRLLASLDPEVVARTHVVVLGDNGTADHGIAPPLDPFRDKGSVFEGGVRVPLIVRGPSVRDPGAVSDALVHVVDVMPTVLGWAGVDPFEVRTRDGRWVQLDGMSLAPVLADPKAAGHERLLAELFEPNGLGPYDTHNTTVRDRDYKYIRHLDGRESLYRLRPGELDEGDDLLLAEPTDTDLAARAALSAYVDDELVRLGP